MLLPQLILDTLSAVLSVFGVFHHFQVNHFIEEIHLSLPRISAAGFFDVGKPLLITVLFYIPSSAKIDPLTLSLYFYQLVSGVITFFFLFLQFYGNDNA